MIFIIPIFRGDVHVDGLDGRDCRLTLCARIRLYTFVFVFIADVIPCRVEVFFTYGCVGVVDVDNVAASGALLMLRLHASVYISFIVAVMFMRGHVVISVFSSVSFFVRSLSSSKNRFP